MRAWVEKHRARLRAQRRAEYAANPEKFLAPKREWARKNPERARELKRLSYARNKAANFEKRKARRARTRTQDALRTKLWRQANLDYEFKPYGLTATQYESMHAAQSGLCAICQKPETKRHNKSGEICRLAVDHDHDSNEVRGLLCAACNIALGYFDDDPDRLAAARDYLIAARRSRLRVVGGDSPSQFP